MKSDWAVRELETVRDRIYHDQPDMIGPVEGIVDILQYLLCEHEWQVHQNPDTPDGPGERVICCKKCGNEKQDD